MKKTLFLLFLILNIAGKANATDDAGVVSIDSVSLNCPGNADIYVTVKNFGTNVITSLFIDWTVNGMAEPSVPYNTTLNPGDSAQIMVGNFLFVTGTVYEFRAWTRSPNGALDTDASNDTSTVGGIAAALSGSYTIGGAGPDFMTWGDAIQALVASGLCGPVEFVVRTGVYNEKLSIPSIQGSSATNTILFRSETNDSSGVLLDSPSMTALTDNYTLQLNGADYITFRNLGFSRSGSGTASTVVEITNESNNVSFIGNLFNGPTSVTTSNTDGSRSGIYSPITHSNDNLLISGNNFQNNACGIWVNGSTSSPANGMVVENNHFETFYVGAFILYQNAPRISGNTCIRNTTTATVDYFGISIRFTTGPLLVSKNRVTGRTGNYGIRLRDCVGSAGGEGLVVNNFVQVGGTGISRGISLEESSGFVQVYNNNVNATGTSATLSRAFYADGVSTSNVHILNNIFSASGGGYAIYVSDNAQAGIITSNYNCFFSPGVLAYWSGTQATLNLYQAASAKDGNSVSGNPGFVSVSDLHATSAVVSGNGTPLIEVPDDIDGETRDPLAPDIGADEFILTGISSMADRLAFSVYPNPASEILYIESAQELNVPLNITITDLNGKVLLDETGRQSNFKFHQVDISSLEGGYYLIAIQGDGYYQRVPFVILK